MMDNEYLDKHIFYGLANLNDGFDVPGIKYFSEKDFEIVLNRIKDHGISVYGIEPWLNRDYYATSVYEDYTQNPFDSTWYFKAFEELKTDGEDLQYAASYFVPEAL
jgi:hypothetical protein